ncbi:MAG: nicotinate phosphoribosyltransferase [Xenococcaceae cyanobacterium MO_167.B52]|nr:nicotinate phosphoribosyltransferase [Xenococcaceae cyanobacterium MO_167.B52]
MYTNLILSADSYKASHYLQYPPQTSHVSSYIESRGGDYDQLIFFGLQAFLKQYLTKPLTQEHIEQAGEIITAHGLPFNRQGWEYILQEHNGYLPLAIEAVPEGTVIPTHNVLVQVVNTDPQCFWLTSYIETALLRGIWYPTTVATLSWQIKQIITQALAKTADNLDSLPFKLHDFGARGTSSYETAALGGAAHLVNFLGTDTLASLLAVRNYYHEPMAGFSIPAAEHSTITSWGQERETEAYENMLKQFAGEGKLVAVVSDSYNLWHAIAEIWGNKLKEQVINNGGTIVIRPDSGNPVDVVCQTIEMLMEKFGYSVNSKGYRQLPDYLRVIQGDGIALDSIGLIVEAMTQRGLSAENIAFGMGGGLLQKVNRDSLKFAMKASAVKVNNVWCDVFKAPITDFGKTSKKGRLALIKNQQNDYQTVRIEELGNNTNQLRTVFENGQLLIDDSFETIRSRAAQSK